MQRWNAETRVVQTRKSSKQRERERERIVLLLQPGQAVSQLGLNCERYVQTRLLLLWLMIGKIRILSTDREHKNHSSTTSVALYGTVNSSIVQYSKLDLIQWGVNKGGIIFRVNKRGSTKHTTFLCLVCLPKIKAARIDINFFKSTTSSQRVQIYHFCCCANTITVDE